MEKHNQLITEQLAEMGITLELTGGRVVRSPFTEQPYRVKKYNLTVYKNGNFKFSNAWCDSISNFEKWLNETETETLEDKAVGAFWSSMMDASFHLSYDDRKLRFDDFCNEYGYEIYEENGYTKNEESYRICKACFKTYEAFKRLRVSIEKLQEIFQDY